MLTRDQILAVDDLPRQEVTVPEWNGSVYVRAFNGAERAQLERIVANANSDDEVFPRLAALSIVDEHGERMFSDEDVAQLAKKHGRALQKIVNAALRFNAISDDGVADAGNA
jgi:hypothetical protein